jgi:ATP/maltotriose-dependent transcriptional regulator MalT
MYRVGGTFRVGETRRPVSVAPLVGRDLELAGLREIVAETDSGVGGCVVLTGLPGIGKTRLLDEVADGALEAGLAVAYGRATEIDRSAPASTLASTLRSLRPKAPDLTALTWPADRFFLVDRLGEVLEAQAADRPLLIIIDDVQWADEFSAHAIRVLVNTLSSSPVRWLLSRRRTKLASDALRAIDQLARLDTTTTIELGPLDEAALTELCRATLDAEPDATVLALAAGSNGNPFLLLELLRAMKATGQILISAGTASAVGGDLPASFPVAVQQQLQTLPELARSLLQAAAIFGRPFTIHAAAQLLGAPVLPLAAAAEEAVISGMLVEQDTRFAFRHDLLRQALYQGITPPVRAAMHREAATILQAEGHPVVEVAEHLVRGGEAGDRRAVEALRMAAATVAGQAPSTAADLIMHALGLLPDDDKERPALSAEAVGLLASAGRLAEARRLGESALQEGLDPHTTATLRLGLAEAFKHAGHNRLAVEYAQRALQEPDVAESIQAGLQAISAHGLLYIDQMAAADQAGAEADRLGMRSGEFAAAVFGKAARSVVARADGRLADALEHAGDAVAIADRERGEALHRHPRIWHGAALAALDLFAEAEAAFALGRLEAERLGTAWSQPLWHFYHASLLTAKGWLDEAAAEAEAGIQIAQELTALQLSVPLHGLLAKIATFRDDLPQAREQLQLMRRLRAQGITAAPEDVLWPIAFVQYADDEAQLAVRSLADVYRDLPDRLLLLCNDPGAAAELVRVAVAAEAWDRARAAAEGARRLAERNPGVASLAGAAAHAHGLLSGDIEALRMAVEHYRGSPRPLARAAALADAAEAEARAGRTAVAGRTFEAALEEYRQHGAARPARRIEQRIREISGRRGAGPEVERAGAIESPLAKLTPAELRVAQLVAQTRTNRQIAEELVCSPYTVDSHMRHIFRKLNVRSRSAVAVIVSRWR